MLEHNQIILRSTQVKSCIYGKQNTKQIEVEIEPVKYRFLPRYSLFQQ